MTWWQWFLASLMILVCLFLMLVILIQRGRGSGLAGAFGGAGGSSAFGAKTGDVLTWATVVITAVFLFLAVVLNFKFDESPKPVAVAQPEEVPPSPATLPDGAPEVGGNVKVIPLDGPPAGIQGIVPGTASPTGEPSAPVAGGAETTLPPTAETASTTGEAGAAPSETKEKPDP